MRGNDSAIVMMSMGGQRQWAGWAFETFQRVADQWGVDAHLITEDDADDLHLGNLSHDVGRAHKRAYALKAYYPWKFLAQLGYKNVLMVDDTCVVHPYSPNIFQVSPQGHVGLTATSAVHARQSFRHIERLALKGTLDQVAFDKSLYGNTGVVLYRQEAAHAFSPENIMEARKCLLARMPHQTLFYYLHRKSSLDVFSLNKRWNRTPGLDLTRAARKNMKDAALYVDPETSLIMHFTSVYRNRGELVKNVATSYRAIQVNADTGLSISQSHEVPPDTVEN